MVKGPLFFLEPIFSQYYNAIVRPMMTFLVSSSKVRDLQHWGRTICSKNKLEGHGPEDLKYIVDLFYRADSIVNLFYLF